ncbi:lipoprotein insertase outer membrane protein LolB [Endozoicomonas sp. OPT23]|uniref:lipoprotein insertase outer membrane protein LolB n=1 Tax=Endozoicomonas sp. OPT23 TaxID=2072845 RepID=UPI001891D71A
MFTQTMNPVFFYRAVSKWLLAAFCVVLVSGCATVPKPEVVVSEQVKQQLWQENKQHRQKVVSWQLTGRMGLRVPGESGTLSLEWLQNQTEYKLYLDGPLGTSVARIEGNKQGITLWADGKKYLGRDPESLLLQLTGWDLPVSLLRYWIVGIPAPWSDKTLQLNSQGLAEKISQSGWQVEYLGYKDFKGVTLPSRLRVTRGEIRVTLSIRNWLVRP